MNNKKNLIIALTLIVVLAAGTFLITRIRPNETAEEPKAEDSDAYTLFNTPAESLAEIYVQSEGFEIKAVNKGASDWTIDGLDEEDVSEAKAFGLAGTVSNLMSRNCYTAPADLSQYGLDAPSVTVTMRGKDGSENKLFIGALSATMGEYFVMRSGDDNVYTIYRHKVDTILEPVSYYTEFNRFIINADEISAVKITRASDNIEIKIKDDLNEYSSVIWEMTSPYKSNANDDYIDSEILAPISQIELLSPVEDGGLFGDTSTVVEITVTPYDDIESKFGEPYTERLEIGRPDGDKVYVKYKDRVYLVPKDSVSFADDTAFNIVSKMQALVDIRLVKSVDIEYDGKTNVMDITHESDNKYSFRVNGADADRQKSHEIYEDMISLSADMPYKGGETGETVLKITYHGIKAEDDTVIEMKKSDEINCALVKNGTADFTIRYSKIEDFKELFEEYVSTSLTE